MLFSYPPHLTILACVFSDFFFWLTTKCPHAVPKCEQLSYQYIWPTLATYNKSCEWCEVKKKQLSNKSPEDGFPSNYCGRKTVMSLTVYWSLDWKFIAKLKLESRNRNIQYGHQAAILKVTLVKIHRLLSIPTGNVLLKFGLDIQSQTKVRVQQGKSEGFDSCDRPSNLTQIGFESSIFQPVWPWNLMDDPKKQ